MVFGAHDRPCETHRTQKHLVVANRLVNCFPRQLHTHFDGWGNVVANGVVVVVVNEGFSVGFGKQVIDKSNTLTQPFIQNFFWVHSSETGMLRYAFSSMATLLTIHWHPLLLVGYVGTGSVVVRLVLQDTLPRLIAVQPGKQKCLCRHVPP